MTFEYTVIPAPDRGEKARGAKTATDRFALSMASTLNEMGAEGWEYVRAETLPSEERSGLTGRTTVYHNLLIFRREIAVTAPASAARPFSQPMRAVTGAIARQDLAESDELAAEAETVKS